MDKSYWEQYYETHQLPASPSTFSVFVSDYLKSGHTLVELGCGNGRDSLHFGENLKVIAVDQCENEVKFLNSKFSSENLTFFAGDFTNLKKFDSSIEYIYSRFTFHSVDEESETRTLQWVYDSLNDNGLFFVELRSIKDELCGSGQKVAENAYVTDHYRRFSNKNELEKKIKEVGFEIIYIIEDKGLAIYKDEDPVVIRVVAKKT